MVSGLRSEVSWTHGALAAAGWAGPVTRPNLGQARRRHDLTESARIS